MHRKKRIGHAGGFLAQCTPSRENGKEVNQDRGIDSPSIRDILCISRRIEEEFARIVSIRYEYPTNTRHEERAMLIANENRDETSIRGFSRARARRFIRNLRRREEKQRKQKKEGSLHKIPEAGTIKGRAPNLGHSSFSPSCIIALFPPFLSPSHPCCRSPALYLSRDCGDGSPLLQLCQLCVVIAPFSNRLVIETRIINQLESDPSSSLSLSLSLFSPFRDLIRIAKSVGKSPIGRPAKISSALQLN